jgi:hypothetical protein
VPQAAGVRAALPGVDRVLCAGGGGDREAEPDSAVVGIELPLHGEAGVGEDLQHRRVLGQRLRDEPAQAVLAGQRGQVLQQQCADAAVLLVVRDEERDLRIGRAGQRLAAGHPDHHTVLLGDQRQPAVVVLAQQVLQVLLTRSPAGREVAQVDAPVGGGVVQGPQRRGVVVDHRAQVHQVPVGEQRVPAAAAGRVVAAGCGLGAGHRRSLR